jgi:hypothetical protein
MLNYLAMTSCADGAVVDVTVQTCLNSPGMVEVSSLSRRTQLEQFGWKGFSSDDL